MSATCSSTICVEHLLIDAELPQQRAVDAAAELLRYACICDDVALLEFAGGQLVAVDLGHDLAGRGARPVGLVLTKSGM